jgi:short-subunit dehydrogenase
MRDPRSILITGASSGLGEALARTYARPGVSLALLGRDPGRLVQVAEACRTAGAQATTMTLDVTDAAALAAAIVEFDHHQPVDLAIANAGVSGGTLGGSESAEQTRRIAAINIDGVVNTVAPLIAPMSQRRRGQIALMSSLASFRGFPGAPAYCASKAWVRVWGEALRVDLATSGVEVSVICPGYVDTRMTRANGFHMPLLMTAERAARIIIRGLERNRARIAFPWRMYAAVRLLAALPASLVEPALRCAPRKA